MIDIFRHDEYLLVLLINKNPLQTARFITSYQPRKNDIQKKYVKILYLRNVIYQCPNVDII